jgi:hypothetical protein
LPEIMEWFLIIATAGLATGAFYLLLRRPRRKV